MSTDADSGRPSFRFRDKYSRMKDRVKEKLRDKAIKHNVTYFIHENITNNYSTDSPYSQTTRHGFRQQMHHFKDVLKNKTHYTEFKDKFKEKINDQLNLDDNKTYPKGFYDSLFSPETENDVYLQTALICLWIIAVLCIIPTIIVIFLPARKKTTNTTNTTSANMIFFHVFFCELCYLTYVLLAMINVAKDFHLGPIFCDIANYGMYVTIPIMQFALLFLSLERLSRHFDLPITCAKIFKKPFLIQVILCAIWGFLLALLVTVMFIKKQFSFNFIKDQISHIAPPLVGDVVDRLKRRRHHCSIDGRLSSVFKTIIIILFVILIVKPILISIGMNVFTPFCCRKQKKQQRESYGERRTTKLVTIFLLLNFFFSFPYYFVSMFKSLFTNIDATKDTFTIVLKICFILRIVNIIFECLAFYIFERNSWNLLSKVFYYATCKKFPIFNAQRDDDTVYTKDKKVLDIIKKAGQSSDQDDDDDEEEKTPKKKRKSKVVSQDDNDDDDDGAFRKTSRKKSITQTPEASEDEDAEISVIKPRRKTSAEEETVIRRGKKKQDDIDDDKPVRTKKTKSKVTEEEEDDDEDDDGSFRKKPETVDEEEESEDEEKPVKTKKKKVIKKQEEESEEEEKPVKTKKKKTVKKQEEEVDEDEPELEETTTTKKRKPKTRKEEKELEVVVVQKKSKPKRAQSDEEEEEEEKPKARSKITVEKEHTSKSKSDRKYQYEREEEKQLIEKSKSKPRHSSPDNRHPNGKLTSKPQRFQTPSNSESDGETNSQTSQTSHKKSKPIANKTNQSKSRVKTHTSKKPKKDRRIEILEMSHEV